MDFQTILRKNLYEKILGENSTMPSKPDDVDLDPVLVYNSDQFYQPANSHFDVEVSLYFY